MNYRGENIYSRISEDLGSCEVVCIGKVESENMGDFVIDYIFKVLREVWGSQIRDLRSIDKELICYIVEGGLIFDLFMG